MIKNGTRVRDKKYPDKQFIVKGFNDHMNSYFLSSIIDDDAWIYKYMANEIEEMTVMCPEYLKNNNE